MNKLRVCLIKYNKKYWLQNLVHKKKHKKKILNKKKRINQKNNLLVVFNTE